MNRPWPFPLRGALLDLDGTLTDTEPFHFEAANVILAASGASLSWERYDPLVGMAEEEFWRTLSGWYGLTAPWQKLAERRTREYVRLLSSRTIEPLPGVLELLDALEHAGIPAVVASASPAEQIAATLGAARLRHRLRDFVSAHDDVPRSKPAPDVYVEAASRIGVDPAACVAVEDSTTGMASARASGAFVIGVSDRDGDPDLRLRSIVDLVPLIPAGP
jgi:HAD superfamily hydrolase (TIGR01509 family)